MFARSGGSPAPLTDPHPEEDAQQASRRIEATSRATWFETALSLSSGSLGREPINSEWSTDVRFGAHSGHRSDIV